MCCRNRDEGHRPSGKVAGGSENLNSLWQRRGTGCRALGKGRNKGKKEDKSGGGAGGWGEASEAGGDSGWRVL